jgi:anti-anti-sigma regulatory factor
MALRGPDDGRSSERGDLGELSRAPFVRREDGLGRPGRPVTAVFLHGEHDFGCRGLVVEALDPVRNDVLVDLSWCTFVDSSIIASILAKHAALVHDGHRLEVILPPTHTHLVRTFERLGARRLLAVHDAPPAAERRDPGNSAGAFS